MANGQCLSRWPMAYPDGLSTQTAYPDCPAYLVQLLQVGRNNSLISGTSPPQLEHLLEGDGGGRRVEVGVLSLWGVRGVQLGSEFFFFAIVFTKDARDWKTFIDPATVHLPIRIVAEDRMLCARR